MCRGVLNEMCLGVEWLRPVMASMVEVEDLFGILNLMIPSLSDVAHEGSFCGHVESWKT